jgi:hypothetical protein
MKVSPFSNVSTLLSYLLEEVEAAEAVASQGA